MRDIKITTALFVVWMFIAYPLSAQEFEVDTLVYNGSTDQHINLVVLGDGYTSAQMNSFIVNANSFKDYFFSRTPFSNYKNYFNVFIIKTPSVESGAKHPKTSSDCITANPLVPVVDPNNYYGSTFDAYGIHRLLVPMNTSVIATVLANNFPSYDQVIVLVNTPYSGGSGGEFATVSIDVSGNDAAVHEIGHSFAGLADEYWAGSQYAIEKPNMTQDNSSNTIKWKNWLTAGTGIGVYPFIGQSWYKPTEGTCEMQLLYSSFCSVCSEAIVEQIHQLVNPIERFSPLSSMNTITDSSCFSLKLMKPNPSTLNVEWSLNNSVVGTNVDSIFVNIESLIDGSNTISVKVIDTTSLSRSDSHLASHLYVTSWTISKNSTGFSNVSSKNNSINIRLYPNPSPDYLNVTLNAERQEYVSILIYSSQGILMKSIGNYSLSGDAKTITIDIREFAAGPYSVEFRTKSFVHVEEFVKL